MLNAINARPGRRVLRSSAPWERSDRVHSPPVFSERGGTAIWCRCTTSTTCETCHWIWSLEGDELTARNAWTFFQYCWWHGTALQWCSCCERLICMPHVQVSIGPPFSFSCVRKWCCYTTRHCAVGGDAKPTCREFESVYTNR